MIRHSWECLQSSLNAGEAYFLFTWKSRAAKGWTLCPWRKPGRAILKRCPITKHHSPSIKVISLVAEIFPSFQIFYLRWCRGKGWLDWQLRISTLICQSSGVHTIGHVIAPSSFQFIPPPSLWCVLWLQGPRRNSGHHIHVCHKMMEEGRKERAKDIKQTTASSERFAKVSTQHHSLELSYMVTPSCKGSWRMYPLFWVSRFYCYKTREAWILGGHLAASAISRNFPRIKKVKRGMYHDPS